MMDAGLKAKWIAALRSGKYTQTTKVMRDDIGFCCLGVLQDIIDPDGWEEKPSYCHPSSAHRGDGQPYIKSEYLSGFIIKNDQTLTIQKVLALMNDGDDYGSFKFEKHDFNQIADFIEENVK